MAFLAYLRGKQDTFHYIWCCLPSILIVNKSTSCYTFHANRQEARFFCTSPKPLQRLDFSPYLQLCGYSWTCIGLMNSFTTFSDLLRNFHYSTRWGFYVLICSNFDFGLRSVLVRSLSVLSFCRSNFVEGNCAISSRPTDVQSSVAPPSISASSAVLTHSQSSV